MPSVLPRVSMAGWGKDITSVSVAGVVKVRYQSGTDRMSRTMTRVEGRTMNSAGPVAEGEPLCQS